MPKIVHEENLQLLTDIRDCFAHHADPERLSTAALLEWLSSRPVWSCDRRHPMNSNRLAYLLAPFHIYPRVLRFGSASTARGYQLGDFVEHWQTHFAFDVPVVRPDLGGNHGLQSVVTHVDHVEIANKDAGCHSVTDSRADSETHPGFDVGGLALSPVEASPAPSDSVTPDLLPVPWVAVTDNHTSEIVNKDAGCHSVTDSRAVFTANQR